MLVTEHNVLAVSTGVDALGRIVKGECFDLILCDLMDEARLTQGLEVRRGVGHRHVHLASEVVDSALHWARSSRSSSISRRCGLARAFPTRANWP
jgi:hypothetical protein